MTHQDPAFTAKGRFWRGNLHTHSTRSDGVLSPEEVCRRYKAEGGNTDIWVVSANGGQPRRLTATPGADTSPSYSPDGRRTPSPGTSTPSRKASVPSSEACGSARKISTSVPVSSGSTCWA